MAIDESKLNEFLDRFVTDLGATAAAGSAAIGHRLSLYRAPRRSRPAADGMPAP